WISLTGVQATVKDTFVYPCHNGGTMVDTISGSGETQNALATMSMNTTDPTKPTYNVLLTGILSVQRTLEGCDGSILNTHTESFIVALQSTTVPAVRNAALYKPLPTHGMTLTGSGQWSVTGRILDDSDWQQSWSL